MINGKTIKIRTIMGRDLDDLALLFGNLESLGAFLPTALASEANLRKEYCNNGFFSKSSSKFLITDHSDQILGSVWTFKAVPYFDAIEVGYLVFDKKHRNRGIATEALTLITNYLFESSQVNRVETRISVENPASEKVVQKVGFVHEGINREAAFLKGRLHDMHIYAVLRRDWPIPGNVE